jgi:hypothetical protein
MWSSTVLLLVAEASALVVPHAHATITSTHPTILPHRAAPTMMKINSAAALSSLKETVMVPGEKQIQPKSVAGAVGLPSFLGGAYTLLFPIDSLSCLFGNAAKGMTPMALALTQCVALTSLVLGARVCRGDDASAAATGAFYYGGLAFLLQRAIRAGTISTVASARLAWGALLVALYNTVRVGGLWKAPNLVLRALLPRTGPFSKAKNEYAKLVSGSLLLYCGGLATLRPDRLVGLFIQSGGGARMASSTAALLPLVISIGGLNAVALAGRVFGEKSAAEAGAIGAIMFAGWAHLLRASHLSFTTRWSFALLALLSTPSVRASLSILPAPTPRPKPAAGKKKAAPKKKMMTTLEERGIKLPEKPSVPPPAGFAWDAWGRLVVAP